MRIKKFFESYDKNISDLQDVFINLSDEIDSEVTIEVKVPEMDYELVEFCCQELVESSNDRGESYLEMNDWIDKLKLSLKNKAKFKKIVETLSGNIYAVDIQLSRIDQNLHKKMTNLIGRYHNYGELQLLLSYDYIRTVNGMGERNIFARNEDKMTKKILSIVKSKNISESVNLEDIKVSESVGGISETISDLQDIFADLSDKDDIVIYVNHIYRVKAAHDNIARSMSMTILSNDLYKKFRSLVENRIFEVIICTHNRDVNHAEKTVKSRLKEITERSGYKNLTIISEIFEPYSYRIIFLKDKEEVIKNLKPHNSLNESTSEVEDSLLDLEEIIANISDDRYTKVTKVDIINNANTIFESIFSIKEREKIRNIPRFQWGEFFKFFGSIIDEKIFKIVIEGKLNENEITEIRNRFKYLDYQILFTDHDKISKERNDKIKYDFTSIWVVKNREEIVQKTISYNSYTIVKESKSELEDIFANISDDVKVNIDNIDNGGLAYVYHYLAPWYNTDILNDYSFGRSIIDNVYKISIDKQIKESELKEIMNRCSYLNLHEIYFCRLRGRTIFIFVKDKEEVTQRILNYRKVEDIMESKSEVGKNISIIQDIFVSISDEMEVDINHIPSYGNAWYIYKHLMPNEYWADSIDWSEKNYYTSLIENNIYKVGLERRLSKSSFGEAKSRCEYENFKIIMFDNKLLILVKDADEIVQKANSHKNIHSPTYESVVKESKNEEEDTISILEDIFSEIEDRGVKVSSENIFSTYDICIDIIPQAWLKVRWVEFHEFCDSVIDNKVYRVLVKGKLTNDEINNTTKRCKRYANISVFNSTRYPRQSVIVFIKDKEEIERKILDYKDLLDSSIRLNNHGE